MVCICGWPSCSPSLEALTRCTFYFLRPGRTQPDLQYIYINYRESASRFSRGTVLNMLKQSGINILRGRKDFFPLKIYIYIYISFFNLVFFFND